MKCCTYMLSVCVCVVVAAVAWRKYENSRWVSRDLSFCRAPKVGRGGVCVCVKLGRTTGTSTTNTWWAICEMGCCALVHRIQIGITIS